MAAPRNGYLVHLAIGASPVLVLDPKDAKNYPGAAGVEPVVIMRADTGTTEAPHFYVVDRMRHPHKDAAPLVFDKAAADARDALRAAARQKAPATWTDAERAAMGDT